MVLSFVRFLCFTRPAHQRNKDKYSWRAPSFVLLSPLMEPVLILTSLVHKYLAWCVKHRSARTVEWYQGHLDGFLAYMGEQAAMPVTSLKPYHVVEWVD